MNFLQRKNKRERGQSLVEFAVSVVILLLLLSGIVDLGRLFFQYISMRDAAQEGATYGILYPDDISGIQSRAMVILSNPSDPDISVNVTINSAPCGGNEIIVTVTDASFQITTPFLGAFLGGQTIPVSTSISGTILRPSCSP